MTYPQNSDEQVSDSKLLYNIKTEVMLMLTDFLAEPKQKEPCVLESAEKYSVRFLYFVKNVLSERATLSHRPKVSLDEWRAIDTAPKDGTKILATDGCTETWCVFWSEKKGRWYAYDCADDYYSIYFTDYDLTHWMPLPKPPLPKQRVNKCE